MDQLSVDPKVLVTLKLTVRSNLLECLPVLLCDTEVSPTNFAINQSMQFTLNKVLF